MAEHRDPFPPVFRRYVAVGDSSTEGLEDLDAGGQYRGWADRLALLVAEAQDAPLEYANLAVRGLRAHEIRERQLGAMVELEPDLVSIFAGVNDVIGARPRFGPIEADLAALFEAAADLGATTITFTMPDPVAINPLAASVRERMFVLNDLIRATASAYGALVVDLQRYPIAEDPRLWFVDRLHGNAAGHARVAAAMAWRLGIAGSDDSWATEIQPAFARPRGRERLATDVDWAVHYFAPWLGKGLRRVPHGRGIEPKRPVPTVVDVAAERARRPLGSEC